MSKRSEFKLLDRASGRVVGSYPSNKDAEAAKPRLLDEQNRSDDVPKLDLVVIEASAAAPIEPNWLTGHDAAQAVESRARLEKLDADAALEAADRKAVKKVG